MDFQIQPQCELRFDDRHTISPFSHGIKNHYVRL